MSSTKTIQIHIPEKIQKEIDDGSYILRGNQVRDQKGRIICNLDSLEVDSDHYFSPQIFIQVNNSAFISNTAISIRLHNDLKEEKDKYLSLNNKLDRILENQTNVIISTISVFNEHFQKLSKNSYLTNEKETFNAGVNAAAILSANIESYIKDYINNTIIYTAHSDFKGEELFKYIEKDGYKPRIIKSNFKNFRKHHAFYLAYSFIGIINNLNLLSLCYDSSIYEGYNENLNHIKDKLLNLLSMLIHGVGDEGDIYQMCYTTNYSNSHRSLNINKFLMFDNKSSIDALILRSFEKKQSIHIDENRLSSIYSIIEIIEDIDNLLSRGMHLSELKLSDLSELSDLKKIVFNKE